MLRVMAAAAPPLVIIVLSSCGEDFCGPSFWPAFSDCAGGDAWLSVGAAATVAGFAGRVVVVIEGDTVI